MGYSPYQALPPISASADRPSEIRKEVRRLIADGADVLKIYMESYEKRQLRQDRLSGAMNYSQEELNVLTEEAHRAGMKADLIAFRGDPLAEIRSLQHVLSVMKEGKVFKQEK